MEADEVNWEMFRADLKVSKMVINQPRPSLRFDIPILPKAPPYRPGSGPPPPKVDLQLVHDTNSFIVDKVILPLGPITQPDDPRQRRVYYIVGWPDLPAARPVIDAMKILDYVSPHMLEEWEYQDALRREAEREEAAKQEREAREAREAAEAAEAAATATGKGLTPAEVLPKEKKKRGRKPKQARLKEIRAPTPQLDSEQEAMLAKRKHAPSLSTPQKSRVAQLEAEMNMLEDAEEQSMDEDPDAEAQIQRQLENNILDTDEDNVDVDVNLEQSGGLDLLRASGAVSGGESSSRASSPRLAPPPREQAPPKRATPIARSSAAASARASPVASSAKQQRQPAAGPSRLISQSKPQTRMSTTPIPLPTRVFFNSNNSPGLPPVRKSMSADPPTETRRSTPQGRPSHNAFAPATSDNVARVRSPFTDQPLASNGNMGFTPTNSFTPLGGLFSRPPKRPAQDLVCEGQEHDTKVTQASTQARKERKNKAPKISQPPLEPVEEQAPLEPVEEQAPLEPVDGQDHTPPTEQEYVVKRLEGHEVLDGVHYFKVRWEGDWPPEQNPTWEPQENISADLVKNYLKRKAQREAEKAKHATPKVKTGGSGITGSSTGKSREKQQRTLAQWARTYTSVSEAFEGKAELDATTSQGQGGVQNGAASEDNYDDEADELLVVDSSRAQNRETAAAERRKSLGAQLVAQFGRKTDF